MTCQGHYCNDEIEFEIQGKLYYADVEAECEYTYEPCVMYYKDGSGDPGCEELEVTDVWADWTDENGNAVEQTEEMESALNDYLNKLDYDKWHLSDNYPEPPERNDD